MHVCPTIQRLVYLATALFIATGVFGCAATQTTSPEDPFAQASTQAEKPMPPEQVQRPVFHAPVMVPDFPPPARIDFCGEPVPLERRDVLELFDKEHTLVAHNHAQVYRWLKLKERHFPGFEERLRRLGLPEDLKYVAIMEFEPPLNAMSRRKPVDMRYDFEGSPDAAFLYLGDLYRTFKSWPLAIAAYKSGEKLIMDECRAQGETNCYKLLLPPDTERYVFRVLAIKAVLSDPARYGYHLPKGAGLP